MFFTQPASKPGVLAALDKARPYLPVQPLPPSKGKKDEPRGVKSAGALKKEAEKKGSATAKGKVGVILKIDTLILLGGK